MEGPDKEDKHLEFLLICSLVDEVEAKEKASHEKDLNLSNDNEQVVHAGLIDPEEMNDESDELEKDEYDPQRERVI